MKNLLLIGTLLLCFVINTSKAQENSVTISGGYVFTNIEEVNESSSGWRINALYEYNGMNEHLSHGLSLGYIQTNATFIDPASGNSETELKANHWPMYYAPKYTFLGWESTLRPFVKAAIGWHFSDYDRTGLLGGEFDTKDAGLYTGLGAGVNINISDFLLVNMEYEWAYLANGWYRDGFINTVMLGIGIKF